MVHLFQILSNYCNGFFLIFLKCLFLFPQASTGSVIHSFVIWYLLCSETLWEISKHSQKRKLKVPAPVSGMNYYCVQFIKIRVLSPTFCCEICKLPRPLLIHPCAPHTFSFPFLSLSTLFCSMWYPNSPLCQKSPDVTWLPFLKVAILFQRTIHNILYGTAVPHE